MFWFLILSLILLPWHAWAARSFDGTTPQYLETDTIVQDKVVTMCAWFRTADITTRKTAVAQTSATNSDSLDLQLEGTTAQTVRAAEYSTTTAFNSAPAAVMYTANVWHHGCAHFTTSTLRGAWYDGGNYGNNISSRTAILTGASLFTSIGIRHMTATADPMIGDLAEACIWAGELTDAEVAALGRGTPCVGVRPLDLKSWVPVWGDSSPEPDRVAPRSFTLSGAPPRIASGPPVGGRGR